ITDQVMPRMTGLELAAAISKLRPDLPVLIATGYAEMEPGSGAGLPKLSKPFTQAELATRIAQMRLNDNVVRLRARVARQKARRSAGPHHRDRNDQSLSMCFSLITVEPLPVVVSLQILVVLM